MDILIKCESSGVVREAFRKRGHNAYSNDLKAAEDGSPYHIQGDGIAAMYSRRWDLVIAHPPCTYLAATGSKWLKDQPARASGALVGAERRAAVEDAVAFFMASVEAYEAGQILGLVIENPVGIMSGRYRKPDQIICPTMHGHKEPKKTCLWLHSVPPLVWDEAQRVMPEYHTTKSGRRVPTWFFFADKKDRQTTRSRTFQGIADAMAKQWSTLFYFEEPVVAQ